MGAGSNALLFTLAAVLAASVPFLFRPGLGLKQLSTGAGFALHALASGLLFTCVVLGALWMEGAQGQRAEQRWEFVVVMICLWGVAAFPGFLWRYLRRGATKAARNAAAEVSSADA